MKPRARIETVLSGGTPDAMVWFGDMTYWHDAHATIGDLPDRWQGNAGRSLMHRELGLGEYVPGCCAFRIIEGAEVHCEQEVGGNVRTILLRTPAGTLTERWQYCPDSFSWGHVEFPVKQPDDLAVVRYLYENRRYEPDYDAVRRLDRDLGDFGLPVVATHPSPMAELYKQWIGLVTLSYMLMDEPEAIREILEVMWKVQRPMWEITAASPCDTVMLCENFTAETMGGLFDDFFANGLREGVACLHGSGKVVMCHIDGTLRGLAEKLPVVGIDCLDAVTPAPVGDVAVADLRDLVGPDILILGGLPGAMFAPPFGERQMTQHVLEIIEFHKESGKFMFGVADQVPPNGDLDLVRLVGDLVEEHGRY